MLAELLKIDFQLEAKFLLTGNLSPAHGGGTLSEQQTEGWLLPGLQASKNNIDFCDIYFYVQDKKRERDSRFEKNFPINIGNYF